jgi:hypothetical protein
MAAGPLSTGQTFAGIAVAGTMSLQVSIPDQVSRTSYRLFSR